MTKRQRKVRIWLELIGIRMTEEGWNNLFGQLTKEIVRDFYKHFVVGGHPRPGILDEAIEYDKYCQEVYEAKPLKPIFSLFDYQERTIRQLVSSDTRYVIGGGNSTNTTTGTSTNPATTFIIQNGQWTIPPTPI